MGAISFVFVCGARACVYGLMGVLFRVSNGMNIVFNHFYKGYLFVCYSLSLNWLYVFYVVEIIPCFKSFCHLSNLTSTLSTTQKTPIFLLMKKKIANKSVL